jgi:bifunctional DNA-binding transcriptional regulator/antitoxin component of YhaV-PrlF toxin-antitoxin module
MKALIDELGRVQLPDFVRTQLGVKPGDPLSLDEHDGKWFLGPVTRSASENGADDVMAPSVQASPEAFLGPSDDLSWEELDYAPVPLKSAGQIRVRIEHAGRVKPLVHELDDE